MCLHINTKLIRQVHFTAYLCIAGATDFGVKSVDAEWGQGDAEKPLRGMLTNPQILIGCRSIWTHISKLIPSKPE